MDPTGFDSLARSLASGQSRRGMLHVLAAAALGTLFSARTAREAAAACREAGQRCSNAHGCCPGSRCRRKFCRCKLSQGFRACDGPGTRCVNTNTSEAHCGNCDAPCPQFHVCENGSCIDHCNDGELDGDETDRDCGGDRCPKCEQGMACRDNDDCTSGQCVNLRCVQCTTDTDCEPLAPLASVCVDNVCRQCRNDSDCESDVCIANSCEECRDTTDCPSDKPVCDQFHVCRAQAQDCSGASSCGNGTTCRCAVVNNQTRCICCANCNATTVAFNCGGTCCCGGSQSCNVNLNPPVCSNPLP